MLFPNLKVESIVQVNDKTRFDAFISYAQDESITGKKSKQESVSVYIIRGFYKYLLVVLCLGILLGHLFWSVRADSVYYNTKCLEFGPDSNIINHTGQ